MARLINQSPPVPVGRLSLSILLYPPSTTTLGSVFNPNKLPPSQSKHPLLFHAYLAWHRNHDTAYFVCRSQKRSRLTLPPKTADGHFCEPRLRCFHHHEPGVRRSIGPAGQLGGVVSSRGHDGTGLHAYRRDHAVQFRLPGEQEVRSEDGRDVPPLLGTAVRTGKV